MCARATPSEAADPVAIARASSRTRRQTRRLRCPPVPDPRPLATDSCGRGRAPAAAPEIELARSVASGRCGGAPASPNSSASASRRLEEGVPVSLDGARRRGRGRRSGRRRAARRLLDVLRPALLLRPPPARGGPRRDRRRRPLPAIERLNVDPAHFGRGGSLYLTVTADGRAPRSPSRSRDGVARRREPSARRGAVSAPRRRCAERVTDIGADSRSSARASSRPARSTRSRTRRTSAPRSSSEAADVHDRRRRAVPARGSRRLACRRSRSTAATTASARTRGASARGRVPDARAADRRTHRGHDARRARRTGVARHDRGRRQLHALVRGRTLRAGELPRRRRVDPLHAPGLRARRRRRRATARRVSSSTWSGRGRRSSSTLRDPDTSAPGGRACGWTMAFAEERQPAGARTSPQRLSADGKYAGPRAGGRDERLRVGGGPQRARRCRSPTARDGEIGARACSPTRPGSDRAARYATARRRRRLYRRSMARCFRAPMLPIARPRRCESRCTSSDGRSGTGT